MNVCEISLDLDKHPCSTVVRIGYTDVSAPTLAVSILDHGQAVNLSGYDVVFEMRAPDGIMYAFDGTTSGNVATFVLNGYIPPGITDIAYVALETDSQRFSTQRFRVEILEGGN